MLPYPPEICVGARSEYVIALDEFLAHECVKLSLEPKQTFIPAASCAKFIWGGRVLMIESSCHRQN